ncbi:glycosyltransferase family 9 protein [bacterium]|nr:glycosyltransferase family 9 protein [bacterium]
MQEMSLMQKGIRTNCRFFVGEKPCKFKRLCEGCGHFSPKGKRILIIKLAAVGDVLRTTPILTALKTRYPSSYITWITDKAAAELLRFTELIDELLPYSFENVIRLMSESPDILICLDKEPRASSLASLVSAGEKYGFGWSPEGVLTPLNALTDYGFRLGFDDELKFKQNRKTYQQIAFEQCGLEYDPSFDYVFSLPDELIARAKAHLRGLGVAEGKPVVGLNTGAGAIFATKAWTEDGFVALAKMLRDELDVTPLILGGQLETAKNLRILAKCHGAAIDGGCSHSLQDFAGIIACCDLVVTADTLAMHLALAAKRRVCVIMGPTSEAEIDLYGRGTKIVSDARCAPCYRSTCDVGHICMENISAPRVFEAVKRELAGL